MITLDAITTDPLVALYAGGGGLSLLGGVLLLARAIISWRKHAGNNAAQIRVSDNEATGEALKALKSIVDGLRAETRDLRERTDECQEHRDECRRELHATQMSLTSARYDIGRLSQRVGELLAERGESTGVHEVEEIRARNATPIPARPETIVPPLSSGEEE